MWITFVSPPYGLNESTNSKKKKGPLGTDCGTSWDLWLVSNSDCERFNSCLSVEPFWGYLAIAAAQHFYESRMFSSRYRSSPHLPIYRSALCGKAILPASWLWSRKSIARLFQQFFFFFFFSLSSLSYLTGTMNSRYSTRLVNPKSQQQGGGFVATGKYSKYSAVPHWPNYYMDGLFTCGWRGSAEIEVLVPLILLYISMDILLTNTPPPPPKKNHLSSPPTPLALRTSSTNHVSTDRNRLRLPNTGFDKCEFPRLAGQKAPA